MGRIRLHESRSVSCDEQLSEESSELLFSLAADRFLLGETSDFLITEYSCLRTEIEGIQPPGWESGLRWLLLQDVTRFVPLRADDSWAFEADANKAQVTLSEALFERHWNRWFKDQLADQACINGLTLIRALELGTSSNQADVVSASWPPLAAQIVHFNTDAIDATDFARTFFKNRNLLFDLVREDLDSCAFFISCPIEWINLKSETHIFDTDAELAEQAQRLHEKYLNVSFESSLAKLEDIRDFESLLLAKAPDAFPGAWSPSLISLYVRYGHKIQFGSSAPDEIIAAVRAIDTPEDRRPAELLAFLFGVALGSNKAHGLERLLHAKRFDAVGVAVPDIKPPAAEANNFLTAHDSTVDLAPEVKMLVKLGRTADPSVIVDSRLPESWGFGVLWKKWDLVVTGWDAVQVCELIQGLTYFERMFNRGFGSVTPVANLFRIYASMVESEERDRLADWILRNTVNDYTPYGTSNHGARSLDELHKKEDARFARKLATASNEQARFEDAKSRKRQKASERLPNALRRKDAKAVAALIANGADLDVVGASGQSARTIAAELGVSDWLIMDQADDE